MATKKKTKKKTRRKTAKKVTPANSARADGPNRPGQFQPGQSGNPSGRPKVVKHVRDLARQHTTLAINTLAGICRKAKAPEAARVAAANSLLDRGYGKAPMGFQLPDLPFPGAGETADDNVLPLDRARRIIFAIELVGREQQTQGVIIEQQ